ncbi:putative 2OG-Fe(II) oxygenase [Candidatus Pelagibacter sp. FZCC0015]|uniref:putative 2OG-Fe(II) oxygenase n=1 Tax=Candidatus Pelagibacter sp. FZCC0015 TaxID=2268451 RepID=UPI0011A98B52|nr:putative 2OG-Fe(II) oxygenase [Candidatus Pelagibacter sp. FZCC0015]
MEKFEFQIIKNLGPSVFKTKIPDEILNKINNYIDEIIKDEEKIKELDHGSKLVGDVTQEFQLEKKIMEESGWLNFLANCTGEWIKRETAKTITKFSMKGSWVVRQFQNEYNPTHWHDGHISGAGFLKVPKNFGSNIQKNKQSYQGGNLQLIHGSRMFLSQSIINIVPKVGDLYLFPNYLMHTVFPFKYTNEERRSISFNAVIDNKIYDVYGN